MAGESWKDKDILKKIYVGNLKEETDAEKLKEYFGQYGEISDTKLVKFPDGKSKKCGFITFFDCDVVDNILFNYESHNIDSKSIDVRRAIPKEEADPLAHIRTTKLFVGGLKDDQNEEDIKTALAAFIPFEPKQIKLMKDKDTLKFKGFAFVNFENEHIVDKLFLIRKVLIKGRSAEMKKAAEFGGAGAPGGNRGGPRGGGRGGPRGRGAPRGGGRGGRGGGGGGYGAMGDYSGYPGGGYEGYSYGGYDYNRGGYSTSDYYGNGYGGGYGGGGGGYGSPYGGGGNMGQYTQEQSGYGPSRGRGRGARGGGGGGGGGAGYRPY